VDNIIKGTPPQPGEYKCTRCDAQFNYKCGALFCPSCGNRRHDELVPIFVKEQKEEELMKTEADFPGG